MAELGAPQRLGRRIYIFSSKTAPSASKSMEAASCQLLPRSKALIAALPAHRAEHSPAWTSTNLQAKQAKLDVNNPGSSPKVPQKACEGVRLQSWFSTSTLGKS